MGGQEQPSLQTEDPHDWAPVYGLTDVRGQGQVWGHPDGIQGQDPVYSLGYPYGSDPVYGREEDPHDPDAV
ncbi:MAG: hypothetical protein PHU44_15205 [Syntrophales bacterium]|nr:hypothetical protein [Syntrophales bacterium]MDD5641794.1 hypothetical protein [Syntrophales bacterium]